MIELINNAFHINFVSVLFFNKFRSVYLTTFVLCTTVVQRGHQLQASCSILVALLYLPSIPFPMLNIPSRHSTFL